MNRIANEGLKIPSSEVEKFMDYIKQGGLPNPRQDITQILLDMIDYRPNTQFGNQYGYNKLNLLGE